MTMDASVATKVEQASRKDLPQLKDALARAFYEHPVLGWLMPDEHKRPRRLRKFFELRHPRTPHHYVLIVGVEPELQGRGIGSELMRPTLEHCDRTGLHAYLEASSDRSAALYERLGFRTERELRLGSSPPLRLMIRPPAA